MHRKVGLTGPVTVTIILLSGNAALIADPCSVVRDGTKVQLTS
jgi:hypothetical protein